MGVFGSGTGLEAGASRMESIGEVTVTYPFNEDIPCMVFFL